MRLSLAWLLGWKVFAAPGSSKLLLSSSLAMALGLVPLVMVLSIADGMIEAISSRTIETSLYHGQLWPTGPQSDLETERSRLEEQLKPVSGFRSLWPEQGGFVLAYSSGGSRLGLSLRGIDPRWPLEDSGAARYLNTVAGVLAMEGPSDVWIGREAALKLGLAPGSELKLLTTRTQGTVTVPRVTTVRIAAVVSVGYQELDRLWLFAPLSLTRNLLDPRESPVFWGVKSDAPLERTQEFTAAVRLAVGPSYQVASWQARGRSQFLNYQATRALLAVIMALVLLVAAVNVSTAMVTAVRERRRETAILKALGGTGRLVRGQFLVLGLGAGLLGTAVGLGAGMGLALAVNPLVAAADAVISLLTPGTAFHLLDTAYYLETIPVKFDPMVLAGAGTGCVLLAVAASWWPARRAANDRPLEVLRRA